jgi:ABC-2 type transport system permease protein
MRFSFARSMIIARREYLTTVRRKAFVFSLLLTPAILFFSTFVSSKLASDDSKAHQRQSRIVALVDSSGQFAQATQEYSWQAAADAPARGARTLPGATPARPARTETVLARVRPFASQQQALDSLEAGTVNIVLVVAQDFLETGAVRRYEHDTRVFTSGADDGPMRAWLTRNLLAGRADSAHIERTISLRRSLDLYVPARSGGYQLKDDQRELIAFFLPFIIGFLISMSIVTGGQYLLQGVAEEKETRILESLLTTVTPDELMVGKLLGLGSAGLTMVGIWIVFGLAAGGSMLSMLKIDMPGMLIAVGLVYFLLGYLFYGSLMTGIGAIANNLREAQQFAVIFTMMNFFPFYVLVKILNSPNSGLAIGMSMFPPTAAPTMMMRLCASSLTGAVIPLWQVGASIGLLALTAVLVLKLSSKIFRLGLLLYGKTPNLPEILAILRQK